MHFPLVFLSECFGLQQWGLIASFLDQQTFMMWFPNWQPFTVGVDLEAP